MSDNADNPAWPKNSDGTTNWETVFEDSESGLIPLIMQAHSATTLRECTVVVIKQLHTRKNDPSEVERFIGELSRLVPDSTPKEALPRVAEGIIAILRRIKDDRIARATAYVAAKAAEPIETNWHEGEEDQESDVVAAGDNAEPDDRRVADSEDGVDISKFSFEEEQEPPRYGLYGGIAAVAVAVIGIAGYLIFGGSDADKVANPNKLFLQQIQMAAEGSGPPKHIFGGTLSVGTLAGRQAITAKSVPSENCQSIAWSLASKGNVMISSVMPKRVAPAILKKLCDSSLLGATLIWLPKKKRK